MFLPFYLIMLIFGVNQFGFHPGVGCQHNRRALAFVLEDTLAKGYSLHICAFDHSNTFDYIFHSQALYSLF